MENEIQKKKTLPTYYFFSVCVCAFFAVVLLLLLLFVLITKHVFPYGSQQKKNGKKIKQTKMTRNTIKRTTKKKQNKNQIATVVCCLRVRW